VPCATDTASWAAKVDFPTPGFETSTDRSPTANMRSTTHSTSLPSRTCTSATVMSRGASGPTVWSGTGAQRGLEGG
jgi:hypothetical protein